MPRAPADADTVTYQLQSVPGDTWRAWKDTVPRSTTLEAALVSLMEAEVHGELDADTNDRLALIRIRKLAMRASQQVGDDPDAAREELREITNTIENAI